MSSTYVVGVRGCAAEHGTARHSQQRTVLPRVEQGLQAGTAGTAAHLEDHGTQAGRGGGPRDAGHSARNLQGGARAHVAVHVQRGLQGGWGGKQAGVSTLVVQGCTSAASTARCIVPHFPGMLTQAATLHPPPRTALTTPCECCSSGTALRVGAPKASALAAVWAWSRERPPEAVRARLALAAMMPAAAAPRHSARTCGTRSGGRECG